MAAETRRRLTSQQQDRRDWIIDACHLTVLARLRRRRRAQRLITIGRRS